MKTLLYIGNSLSRHGYTTSAMETLTPLLAQKFHLNFASDKKNIFARLFDMLYSTLKLRQVTSTILIDTFSSWNFYYAVLVGLLARILGIPYIPILRGGNLPMRLERYPRLSKLYFGNAQTLVAPSVYIQEAFSKFGFATQVIPNFIFLKNYLFKERFVLQPRLMWVRSFHKTYNPEMAIRILELLLYSYPEAVLCMVGPDKDGSLEKCKNLAGALGLSDKISFTGLLSKEQWVSLSNDYDIFLNTTNFDNTPVSLIEAMALGLPIVSTDAGGLPYLIEANHDGLLTPVGEVEPMVNSIKLLLENPELTGRLTINARIKAEGFDWAIVQKKWLNLLS